MVDYISYIVLSRFFLFVVAGDHDVDDFFAIGARSPGPRHFFLANSVGTDRVVSYKDLLLNRSSFNSDVRLRGFFRLPSHLYTRSANGICCATAILALYTK